MRIGVYVGSFNPVHKGHVSIVKNILKQNLVDKVLVVVTGNYWDKQNLLPIKDRIHMWQFYENENIIIDTAHNYIEKTYQLFRALKEEMDDDLYLIIGADNIPNFNKWVNYEELLQYPFIVIKRGNIQTKELNNFFNTYNKENYTILNIPTIDISSTEIRENLDDYTKVRKMINRNVYDYLISIQNKG